MSSIHALQQENSELRARLDEAEETLRAIRSGEVDAIVVTTAQGNQVFTLQGADHPYRMLIEEMQQGAVTILDNGTILYSNHRFVDLVSYPMETVFSQTIFHYFIPEDRQRLMTFIQAAHSPESISGEFAIQNSQGETIPVHIAISALEVGQFPILGLVITDLRERRRTEADTARLAAIVTSSNDGILSKNLNGIITGWNRGAERMFGYTADEIIQQPISVLIPAEKMDEERMIIETIATGEAIRSFDTLRLRKDGSVVPVSVSVSPIRNEQGKVVGASTIIQDISERKQAEEDFRKSEERFHTVFDVSTVGKSLTAPDGRMIKINRAFAAMLGYTIEEMQGLNYVHVTHPDDLDENRSYVRRLLEGEREGFRWEKRYLHKDGHVVWADVSTTLVRDSERNPLYLITSIMDITERKRLDVLLRRMYSAVDQSANSVVITNLEGNIEYVNPRFTEVTGYTSDEVLGKNPRILQSGQTPLRVYKEMWNAITSGGQWRGELRNKKKNGELFWELASLSPVKDETGRIIGFLAVKEDITETKRMEAALAQERNLLRTLIDSLPDRIYAKDTEGRFILKNEADARQMGAASTHEIIGKTDFDYYSAELAAQYHADDQAVIQSGQPLINREEPSLDAAGNPGWILTTKVPLRDEQGKAIGLVGIGRDISERKRVEDELRRSEMALTKAQRVAHVGSWVWHTQTNRLEWSDEMYRIFDIDKDSFDGDLGTVIERAIHPDDRAAVNRANASVINDKTPVPLEYRLVRTDGTIRTVRGEAGELILDSDGNPQTLSGVVQDITERKRAEDNLRKLNRTMSLISNINQSLVRIRSLPVLFQDVCRIAVEVGGFPLAWIGLADADTGTVRPVAHAGIDDDLVEKLADSANDSPSAGVLCSGDMDIINDLEHDPRPMPWRAEALRYGYHSAAAFPLTIEGRTCGVLSIYATQPDFFTQDEVELLQEMAGDISFGMEYAEQEKQRKHAEIELREAERFARATIDALSAQIAILDEHGIVLSVNDAWSKFAADNPGRLNSAAVGMDYLRYLESIDLDVNESVSASALLKGIQFTMAGEPDTFSFEYPCHTQEQKRWFLVRLTRFAGDGPLRIVVALEDISEQVMTAELLEEQKSQLTERMKELSCLYNHTKLMERPRTPLEALFQGTVDMIPPALKYPEITCARLTINGRSYTTDTFRETRWHLASDVHVGVETVGVLEVFYLEERQDRLAGPFLYEERLLVHELAHRLGQKIETLQAEASLQEAHHTLEKRVIERTAQLQEAKDQVEIILNSSVDSILLTNPDHTILHTNTAFNRLFACEEREYLNQPLKTLIDAESSVSYEYINAQLAEGQKLFQEIRARRQDGTVFDAEISVGYTKDGGLVCVIRDVSKRKQAEKALAEERNLLRTVIDTVPDLIYLSDTESRIVLNNAANARAWGYDSPLDNVGKTPADAFPADMAQLFMETDRHVVETAAPLINFEARTLGPDRSEVWSLTTKVPFYSVDGELRGIAGVTRDITVQKQAEQALRQALAKEQELNELKTRFVSMASHEFRTPLAVIFSATETLSAYRHKLTDDQIEQRLGNIRIQVGYLKETMDDVLKLAQLQARRFAFNPKRADLDALCREVIAEFEGRADINHTFLYTCDGAVPPANLDRKLIWQLVSNLLSNAVKYAPETEPVRITLGQAGDSLRLTVQDSGIGIPEADLSHLFQPFHRAANVGHIHGTGLGLVIAKEAVDLHGGAITVESQVGVGSTFTVEIPIMTRGE